MAAIVLTLIRHPQPVIAGNICYGSSDLVLAKDPAQAADQLRPQLPAGVGIWSSPLRRCHDLACCLSADVRVDARLAEMHFGDWEGRLWDGLPRHEIDAWAADPIDYVPPGGESARAMQRRALACVGELAAAGIRNAIVVTHGGVIRALTAAARQWPDREWTTLRCDFLSVHWVALECP